MDVRWNWPMRIGQSVRNLQRLASHPHLTPHVECKQTETEDDKGDPQRSPEAFVAPKRVDDLAIGLLPEGIHLVG